MNRIVRLSSTIRTVRALFSEVAKANERAPTRHQRLQFSKARLVDFGELPTGEIPDALKVTAPTTFDKLPNGVRIVTETWRCPNSAITVTINAGSRQETLETSSVAQFAALGALNGTAKHSKDKIDEIVDLIGGHLKVDVTRELTQFTLSFETQFLSQAVDLLSQIVLNPVYDPIAHEAQKQTIYKSASPMEPLKLSMEAVHYTSYRDHMMGQPSHGIRDNVYSITPSHVKEFHSKYYVGNNIVVSGAGNINDSQFKQAIAGKFSSVKASGEGVVPNTEKPLHTPSIIFQRDDQIVNSSWAVGFIAPSWNDPDYFAMQFFKRIIGEWRCDKYNGIHLNSPHLQYNTFHTYLGNNPDLILHKPYYIPYSDTGLFVNFIYGNEMFNQEMMTVTQNQMSIYASYISQTEIFRARNKYWNDLLEYTNPEKVSFNNAKQASYLNRLITRTEAATRISYMTCKYINDTANKWFWDQQISVSGYGNLHHVMMNAHYNRTFKRSTLGEYSYLMVNLTY